MERNVFASSEKQDWTTPQEFFDKLNIEFNFTLDPCCYPETAKCGRYFTEHENGLAQDWSNEVVFMNPPYGREISKWVEKAYHESLKENTVVVALIPARTDTKYWHDFVMKAKEVRLVKGRLKFGEGKNSAPFPSAVVVFTEHTGDTVFSSL